VRVGFGGVCFGSLRGTVAVGVLLEGFGGRVWVHTGVGTGDSLGVTGVLLVEKSGALLQHK